MYRARVAPMGRLALQEHMPGAVPTGSIWVRAEQLVALARRHAADSGQRRHGATDAIAPSWLAFGERRSDGQRAWSELSAALDAGGSANLVETSIVHGDLHHRNCLVDQEVSSAGIFDWEMSGPGDWRCRRRLAGLLVLGVSPSRRRDARALVLAEVRAEVLPISPPLCSPQALRAISMRASPSLSAPSRCQPCDEWALNVAQLITYAVMTSVPISPNSPAPSLYVRSPHISAPTARRSEADWRSVDWAGPMQPLAQRIEDAAGASDLTPTSWVIKSSGGGRLRRRRRSHL